MILSYRDLDNTFISSSVDFVASDLSNVDLQGDVKINYNINKAIVLYK